MREIYRNAMRCLRLTRMKGDPAAYFAAVRLVRSITGHWEIHELPRPMDMREPVGVYLYRYSTARRRFHLRGPYLSGRQFLRRT